MLSGKAMLELFYLSCESKGLSSAKWQSCLSNLNSSPFCNLLMHLECIGKQQHLALMFLMITHFSGFQQTLYILHLFFHGQLQGVRMGFFVKQQKCATAKKQATCHANQNQKSSKKPVWNCLEEFDEETQNTHYKGNVIGFLHSRKYRDCTVRSE